MCYNPVRPWAALVKGTGIFPGRLPGLLPCIRCFFSCRAPGVGIDSRLLNSFEHPETSPDCTAKKKKENAQTRDNKKKDILFYTHSIIYHSHCHCFKRDNWVCARQLLLTQPLGLIDELGRALHKQRVQSLLGGFVRFWRRSATHRHVTGKKSGSSHPRQVPHAVPGFVSCS